LVSSSISSRPQKGERYVVERPFEAGVAVQWKAPFTSGHTTTLPAGLEFVVDIDPPVPATSVIAIPQPYTRWEEEFVDQNDREDGKYGGYHLSVPIDLIAANCVRLFGGKSRSGKWRYAPWIGAVLIFAMLIVIHFLFVWSCSGWRRLPADTPWCLPDVALWADIVVAVMIALYIIHRFTSRRRMRSR
jgi:hypothetical protein